MSFQRKDSHLKRTSPGCLMFSVSLLIPSLQRPSSAWLRGYPVRMYPLNSMVGIPPSRNQEPHPPSASRPWLWGSWCRCSPKWNSTSPARPPRGAAAGGCNETALTCGDGPEGWGRKSLPLPSASVLGHTHSACWMEP